MSYSPPVPLSPRTSDSQGGFIPSLSSSEMWVPHPDDREAESSLGLFSHFMLSSGVPSSPRSSLGFFILC